MKTTIAAIVIYLAGAWVTYGYYNNSVNVCTVAEELAQAERIRNREFAYSYVDCGEVGVPFVGLVWPAYWFFKSSELVWGAA